MCESRFTTITKIDPTQGGKGRRRKKVEKVTTKDRSFLRPPPTSASFGFSPFGFGSVAAGGVFAGMERFGSYDPGDFPMAFFAFDPRPGGLGMRPPPEGTGAAYAGGEASEDPPTRGARAARARNVHDDESSGSSSEGARGMPSYAGRGWRSPMNAPFGAPPTGASMRLSREFFRTWPSLPPATSEELLMTSCPCRGGIAVAPGGGRGLGRRAGSPGVAAPLSRCTHAASLRPPAAVWPVVGGPERARSQRQRSRG
jgi:hypothetical protein